MTPRKKVGIQLPKQAQNQTVEERWSLELEALSSVADIIEIRADTPAEFAEGVRDMDAIITSCGVFGSTSKSSRHSVRPFALALAVLASTWSTSRPPQTQA